MGSLTLLLFARFSPLQVFVQGADGSFTALKGSTARDGLVKGGNR